jgi:Sulfotransferase family
VLLAACSPSQMTHQSFEICRDPIFIIGSPRSGTSILNWALSRHSELWASIESGALYALFGRGQVEQAFTDTTAYPGAQDWLLRHDVGQEEFLNYLGLGLNALVTSKSGGLRWIDKTPANTLVVDLVAQLFPEASFLHILRDGRRVVHSMTHFMNALDPSRRDGLATSGRLPTWTTDFREACRTWQLFVTRATDFEATSPTPLPHCRPRATGRGYGMGLRPDLRLSRDHVRDRARLIFPSAPDRLEPCWPGLYTAAAVRESVDGMGRFAESDLRRGGRCRVGNLPGSCCSARPALYAANRRCASWYEGGGAVRS